MTAANLLELAACDGVQIRFAPSGNLKASGPPNALAKWLPELKALKPAITAVAARVNNAARRCDAYGQLAHFGFGVYLRQGQEGRWLCAAHRPQEAGQA